MLGLALPRVTRKREALRPVLTALAADRDGDTRSVLLGGLIRPSSPLSHLVDALVRSIQGRHDPALLALLDEHDDAREESKRGADDVVAMLVRQVIDCIPNESAHRSILRKFAWHRCRSASTSSGAAAFKAASHRRSSDAMRRSM
jgi:hypothetical protein